MLKKQTLVKQNSVEDYIELFKDMSSTFGMGFVPTFIWGNNEFCISGIDSWRGSYCELSFQYSCFVAQTMPSVDNIIDMLEGAVGKTYDGYKGGDFTMHENSEVWLDNYGDCSGRYVKGFDQDGKLIIGEDI